MAHLIQPIEIDAVKRCTVCQSGKATEAVITNDHMLPPYSSLDNKAEVPVPCGPWTVMYETDGDEDTRGEITFGVSCASSVTIEVMAGAGFYRATAEIYLNDVLYETVVMEDSQSPYPVVMDLTDSPCGNRITIFAYPSYVDVTEPMVVIAEVTAIT